MELTDLLSGLSPDSLKSLQGLAQNLMSGSTSDNQEEQKSASPSQTDNTRKLLTALRPMLREEKQKKLDEIMGILKLFNALPLLKQTGLLPGKGQEKNE